ncbi:hypothetical protein HAX54_008254 [Datura stramonium]|uniref:Uncharacterized protein n=1 Tax=Datura stramonium TaxID=4076 RepID=A0ABS8WXP3_DATST|nr:hypothetical protein [Datura stramonium]
MAKKHASSSASQLKAPVGWGAGHGTTPDGSLAGVHQMRAQIRAHANPQPEVENGDVVLILLNVLETLFPNHGGLSIPQTTLQAQIQV